ncbi:N-acetylneuraminate synthase family protein [Candidatus Pelagibacter sp.]|nr:N-acetylneuraminate synthase family protein [Candidatus Pelagibacter sp.]
MKKSRCFIIAEIGGNFTNFKQAKKLIDLAKKAKVDAVKLQTFNADTLASKKAIFDMKNTGKISQYKLFKKLQIDQKLHNRIFQYCRKIKFECFSTPAHPDDVDMLEKFNVKYHKIGSDDAINIPLLRYVAKTKKKIILSTGMCKLSEIRNSVKNILRFNKNLSILHCVSDYPAKENEINLRAISTLKKEFPKIKVGYSDHTIGPLASLCAVACGAEIIEKHFTYNKNLKGPDHMLSLDFTEMKWLVKSIRKFELMRGNGNKVPTKSEIKNSKNNRKSIVVLDKIKKGDKFSKKNLGVKRPGNGIKPEFIYKIFSKRSRKNLKYDEILKWSDVK